MSAAGLVIGLATRAKQARQIGLQRQPEVGCSARARVGARQHRPARSSTWRASRSNAHMSTCSLRSSMPRDWSLRSQATTLASTTGADKTAGSACVGEADRAAADAVPSTWLGSATSADSREAWRG